VKSSSFDVVVAEVTGGGFCKIDHGQQTQQKNSKAQLHLVLICLLLFT
jgi:hypothetical protein